MFIFAGCASWGAASAEEYYTIGMAYYDMGKFDEAEKWLNRARAKDRTMNASEYNLGRIAFETGRFEDAAKQFESILKRDPVNVMALQAAAYTYIRIGDMEKASALYDRVLKLIPESADDGYNYALVLLAMKRYEEAEEVLKKHEIALLENQDVLLLFARTQKELDKVEALDSYDKWLANNTNAKVSFEYAELLEKYEYFAKAIDVYRETEEELTDSSTDPSKFDAGFQIGRLLLIADKDSTEGITELKKIVENGFADTEAMEQLLEDDRISQVNIESIETLITEMHRAKEAAEIAGDEPEDEETEEMEETEE